jgi:hypothetical protein
MALGHRNIYHYDPPAFVPPPKLVSNWTAINRVLEDTRSFTAP